jgi:hypothetical protein
VIDTLTPISVQTSLESTYVVDVRYFTSKTNGLQVASLISRSCKLTLAGAIEDSTVQAEVYVARRFVHRIYLFHQ